MTLLAEGATANLCIGVALVRRARFVLGTEIAVPYRDGEAVLQRAYPLAVMLGTPTTGLYVGCAANDRARPRASMRVAQTASDCAGGAANLRARLPLPVSMNAAQCGTGFS